jgi:NADP-dependent 3-hydroxy acid dehydrogenase YdfG
MSTVVAVAGGSSGLGRTIVDALKLDGRYEVLILGRKVLSIQIFFFQISI